MADGGFLVKFNNKDAFRCHTVAFDYDEWKYTINNQETKELPSNLDSIAVIPE